MARYQIWPPMSILDGPHGQATEGPRWGWRPYYRISTEDFIFLSHHIRPHDHSPWMTNVNIAPFWELFPVLIIISVRSQWNHHNLSILNYSVYITIYFPVIKCGHGKSPGCWKGSFFLSLPHYIDGFSSHHIPIYMWSPRCIPIHIPWWSLLNHRTLWFLPMEQWTTSRRIRRCDERHCKAHDAWGHYAHHAIDLGGGGLAVLITHIV